MGTRSKVYVEIQKIDKEIEVLQLARERLLRAAPEGRDSKGTKGRTTTRRVRAVAARQKERCHERLCDSMRLGAMLHPKTTGQMMETDLTGTMRGTCALGAAFEAGGVKRSIATGMPSGLSTRGVDPQASMHHVVTVSPEWYALLRTEVGCPVCHGARRQTVSQMIPHLNDEHGWTREAVADWLEPIEVSVEQDEDVQREVRRMHRFLALAATKEIHETMQEAPHVDAH